MAPLSILSVEDFQNWTTVNISGKLHPVLKLKLEGEFRTGDQWRELYYHHSDIGLDHKVFSWLHWGLNFREAFELKSSGWLEERRSHLHITFKWKVIGLEFKDRSRFEYRSFPSKEDSGRYRNKFGISYKIKVNDQFSLTPYIEDEIFVDMVEGEFNRNRFFAGADFKFAKQYFFKLFYLLQTSLKNDEWTSINGLGIKAGVSF